MRRTCYTVNKDSLPQNVRFAVVSDLHSDKPDKTVKMLKKIAPDYILLAGDILESLDGQNDRLNSRTIHVFQECAKIAPSFYCTGNHEDAAVRSQSKKWKENVERKRYYTDANLQKIQEYGVNFLSL